MKALMGASALLLMGVTAAGAQPAATFPNRPLTLIMPWTSGGGTAEVHLRVLAQQAEKYLKQPVVMDFKPGANATLAPSAIATMKPDGYVFGQFPVTVFRQPALAKVSYDPAKDFTYIIHITGYTLGLAVKTDSGIKTWADFVAFAKTSPTPVSYANSGMGGTPHLAMEAICEHFGIKVTQVPFRGAGEMTAALLGNHVKIMNIAPGIKPHVESGDVKPLMFWTPERSSAFPDTPTLKELGMDASYASPYGLAGPKGIDPAIVKILHDALKQAYDSPEHQASLRQVDQPPMYMNTADYTAFALKQIKDEKVMVEKAGIHLK